MCIESAPKVKLTFWKVLEPERPAERAGKTPRHSRLQGKYFHSTSTIPARRWFATTMCAEKFT